MSRDELFPALASLNVTTGAELGTQVHVGHKDGDLTAEGFNPLGRRRPWWKPDGGLWTAQWDETYGGGWAQWCIAEEYGVGSDRSWPHVWLLTPDPEARILVIDTYEDLERVFERWPDRHEDISWREGYPAWLEIAEEFDGVFVTEDGQWRTRLTHPLSLYGWDCESTLWLRWCFERVEYLGKRSFAVKPWDGTDDE